MSVIKIPFGSKFTMGARYSELFAVCGWGVMAAAPLVHRRTSSSSSRKERLPSSRQESVGHSSSRWVRQQTVCGESRQDLISITGGSGFHGENCLRWRSCNNLHLEGASGDQDH